MDYIKISTKELLEWLKKNLNEERYEHSLGTADCAKDLAQKYNLNSEKPILQDYCTIARNVFLQKIIIYN